MSTGEFAAMFGVKKFLISALGGGILGAWVASLFVSKKTFFKRAISIFAGAISADAMASIFIVIYPQFVGLEVSVGFIFGLLAMAVFAVMFEMLSDPWLTIKKLTNILKRK